MKNSLNFSHLWIDCRDLENCTKVENITNIEEDAKNALESSKSERSPWLVALDFFQDIFENDDENILDLHEPEKIENEFTENSNSNQTDLFILNVTKSAVDAKQEEEARFFFPDDKNSIAQKSECLPFIEKLKFCEENSPSSSAPRLQNIYHVLKSNSTLNTSIR